MEAEESRDQRVRVCLDVLVVWFEYFLELFELCLVYFLDHVLLIFRVVEQTTTLTCR